MANSKRSFLETSFGPGGPDAQRHNCWASGLTAMRTGTEAQQRQGTAVRSVQGRCVRVLSSAPLPVTRSPLRSLSLDLADSSDVPHLGHVGAGLTGQTVDRTHALRTRLGTTARQNGSSMEAPDSSDYFSGSSSCSARSSRCSSEKGT